MRQQLIRIDLPNATFATYAYDALGRRIAKDVDDGAGGREVTAYVYDGADILMEFDGAGGFLARYAHGDRIDQPLAMTRGGQDYYVHADHQGSVIRVTDGAGAVVNSYAYDAYGQRLAAVEGVEIAYGYTGREFEPESGLMHYRARTYDPRLGRFLQTDPIGFGAGDLNLYRYVENDPVNFSDPSGECPLCIAAAVIAGGTLTAGAANAPGTDIDQSCLIGTNDLAPILNALTAGTFALPIRIAAIGGTSVRAGGGKSIDLLRGAAQRAKANVGPGRGARHGTLTHTEFERQVKAINHPNRFRTEVSYLEGEVVKRGTRGSVRLDVVEGDIRNPIAVFDLKTGSASLSAQRIAQIRPHLPVRSHNIPITEVR